MDTLVTTDNLTLWELGHRLANQSPYRFSWLPLHWQVKDALRLLANEIYEGRLESNLIYEKERPDHHIPDNYYIRTHLDNLRGTVAGQFYPRRLFTFVSVERIYFEYWCAQTGYPKPGFWFSLDTSWTYKDYREWENYFRPPTKADRRRQTAVKVAQRQWANDPTKPIMQVASSDEMAETLPHFESDSIRKWIAPFAPDSIKGKRGRPKKNENKELGNS